MADGDRVGGVYLEIGSEVAKGTPQDSIKRIRAAVKKAAAIKMPVALDKIKSTDLTAARKLAQESADKVKEVQLPVGLKNVPKAAANTARKAAQEVASTLKPIEFPTDLKRITAKQIIAVRRAAQRVADIGTIEFNVEPGKGATFERKVNDIVDDIEDREADLPVVPDVDSTWASARLSWLTRARTVSIVPTLDKGAVAAVTAGLLALSGARAVTDRIRSLSDTLKNLDRTIPSIAGVSTALTNLGSAGLAGISNLLVIGGGLKDIGAIGLALPGIFAGFGVGIGVMVAALKDAGDVLSDLGPKFGALQDRISSNFWEKAEEPIRNLANTWLPTLNSRLGEVASELGTFFASFSNALSSADNVGHLDSILGSVRESIDIAGEGIAHFTDAMMGLMDVGASYLPDLASWFNRISEDFSAWIEQATESGEIFEWIDTGIQALKDLGRVLWGIGGVFSNLGTAAAAAGGSTLGGLADGLENLNRAMEGPAFQGAMTTVFKGAHDAMAALGPGIGALGDAFVKFAPTLAEIMVLAGEIGSVGLAAIASAFENPAFQGGLTDFFEGVLSGVEAVAPHIPALASAFGSVATFAGTLAGVLGPVLGAAIEALAPVVTSLMEGLGPVAEVLGGWLTTAIQTVGPYIQQLAETISNWVQENPQLAATLGLIAGAIGVVIGVAAGLISALLPVIGTIVSVVTAISGAGGLTVVMGTLSAAFSGLMAAIGPVLAVIAAVVGVAIALGAALVYAWQTSEPFRQAVIGLGEAIMAFLQPIIDFIMTTVVPTVVMVAEAFMAMVQQIVDALIPMWTTMMEIWTAILAILTPVVEFILSVFAPIFTHLGVIVSAAFTFIGTVISTVIDIVTAILQVFLAILQGDWSAAWEAVKNVVAVVWQGIQDVVGAAIDFVWTIIQSVLATIQAVWNAIWSAIASFVVGLFQRIVSAAVGFINSVRNSITNGVNAVRAVWNAVWSWIVNFAVSTFARIVSAVSNGINNARNFVSNGLNAIKSTFSNIWNAIVSFVSSTFSRIVSFISNGISRARSTVSDGLNAIKSKFNEILSAVVSAVSEKISAVVGKFRDMLNRARDAVQGFVSKFKSVGGNIISGLVDGIKGAAGKAVSAAKGVVNDALGGAKKLLGINSPSKEFMKVGEWSGEGFVKGIEDMARKANRAAAEMVEMPAPAPVRIPTGASSPLLTAARPAPVEPSAAERTAEGGGVHLSDESILRLAQTMAELPVTLKVGHRQAGTLSMAGSEARNTMGGRS